MSKENFQNFLDRVAKDDALRRELDGTATGTPSTMRVEALARFATEHGFAVTVDDVRSHTSELSDSQLEAVAGGKGKGSVGQKDWGSVSHSGSPGSQKLKP